jgi:hypothetical protein
VDADPRRNRRIVAGVVGIASFVGAVWLVATGGPFGPAPTPTPAEPPTLTEPPGLGDPPTPTGPTGSGAATRVGFVGLPPEGATPSKPRNGELVLRYSGRRFAHWYQVWVYVDGRLIWQREGDLLEGANERSTGFLEQRLTRRGVQMLQARGSTGAALFGFPWRPPYPASWLPSRAWKDRGIRAFVPSRYAVCYQALQGRIEPARILRWLPAQAARLLGTTDPAVVSDADWLRGFRGACSDLTTDEAREVADALEGAGLGQDEFQQAYGLTYYVEAGSSVPKEVVIRFEPILPHGEVGCSGCG